MMKYVCGAVLVLLLTGSKWAVAAPGDKLEYLQKQPAQMQCMVKADMYRRGVYYRSINIPLAFKNATQEEANKGDPPGDAIYLIDMDKYSSEEVAFVTGIYAAGWNAANEQIEQIKEKIKNHPDSDGFQIEVVLDQYAQSLISQKYLEDCMREAATPKKSVLYEFPLIQTASSKALTCELRSRKFYEDCLVGKKDDCN